MRAASAAFVFLLGGAAQAQTYFPAPTAPAGNPVTTQKALLGMALFWEEQMSSSNTTACGTCHVFSHGGVDPHAGTRVHPGPDGVYSTADDIRGTAGVPARNAGGHYVASAAFGLDPQVTNRKAPSVINVAYQPNLFYDGRAANGTFRDPITNQVVLTGPCAIENLVAMPPVNAVEMAHDGRTWTEVANKIRGARPLALATNLPQRLQVFVGNASSYRELFQAVYGDDQVTPVQIIFAISTYLRTLVSDRSPYDLWLGSSVPLTAAQDAGRQLFSAPHATAAACIQCHGDLNPTSHQNGPAFLQSTNPYSFQQVPNAHNTGVRPIIEDPGVFTTTSLQADQGRFRMPGLRNVALHGTWFHNGSQTSLAGVLDFYNRGGDFTVNQGPEIEPRQLTAVQMANIVAFLEALTDPRVANEMQPFDRPRLGSESATFAPRRFGTGTAGTGGRTPRAVAHEPVLNGTAATLAVQNTLPNTAAFMMWDTDAVQQGFSYAGLQFYLGFYNLTTFYVGQTQSSTSPNVLGYVSRQIPIPANPGLAGTRLYMQWLLIDPQGPMGATTSDATEVIVK